MPSSPGDEQRPDRGCSLEKVSHDDLATTELKLNEHKVEARHEDGDAVTNAAQGVHRSPIYMFSIFETHDNIFVNATPGNNTCISRKFGT